MYLVRILRYIIGYVYFTAQGGFPDRFLNLCNERNIKIKDIEYYENTVSGCISRKKYKSLVDVSRLSGVKLKAVRKYGLVFRLRKNNKRIGLFTGAIIAALFLIYSSSFVWTIEVVGGEKTAKADVINACNSLGLKEGAIKSKIDTNELSRLLIMKLSGKVSWISVNIKGTKATVEIRDYEKWKDDTTYGKPANIVADFDGLIMSAEVYNGVKIVKEGNGVKKGDLLISGIAENRDKSSQFMEARGKITAKHNVITETVSDENSKAKIYTYIDRIKVMGFFGIRIPLGLFHEKEDSYDEFENKKSIYYGKTKLPLSISVITRAYYKNENSYGDINTCSLIDNHTISLYEKFKNTLILSGETVLEKVGEKIKIKTENECIDYIGVKEEIYIE